MHSDLKSRIVENRGGAMSDSAQAGRRSALDEKVQRSEQEMGQLKVELEDLKAHMHNQMNAA
jgi:hypothetical protein